MSQGVGARLKTWAFGSADKMELLLVSAILTLLFALSLWMFGFIRTLQSSEALFAMLFTALFFCALCLAAWHGLLRNRAGTVLLGALIFAAFVFRIQAFEFVSPDYRDFLKGWVEFFRENGFSGLKEGIGDYNVPYLYFLALFSYLPVNDLYLIKFLSIVFDVVLALFAGKLVLHLSKKPLLGALTMAAILLLPTVMLNSGTWAQCDSIYAAFALAGLYYGIKDRPVLSIVLFTVGLGFKLQIVFVLPVLFVLLMLRKIKLKQFVFMPLSYLALMMPAVFTGLPFAKTISVYFGQAGNYAGYLCLNAPSAFAFLRIDGDSPNVSIYSKLGILAAFLFLFAVLFFAWRKRGDLPERNDHMIFMAALVMSIGIPFLLPSMHDRYFFLADVLAVAGFFIAPRLFAVPILVQFGSLLTYQAYLRGHYTLDLRLAAGAMGIAAALAAVYFLRLPAGTEPDIPQETQQESNHEGSDPA